MNHVNWKHHQELHPYVSIHLSRSLNSPSEVSSSLSEMDCALDDDVMKVSRRFLCFCSWTLDVDRLLPTNHVKRLRPVAV